MSENGWHSSRAASHAHLAGLHNTIDAQAAEIERLRGLVYVQPEINAIVEAAQAWVKHCSSRQMKGSDCGCVCCQELDYAVRALYVHRNAEQG